MGNLYENIASLCEKHNIKGAKFCTEAGISKGLLTDLKMGRRTGVSAVTAQKIASYFGVSVAYLLGEETEEADIKKTPSEISEGEQKLLDLFRKIPESQYPMVELLLESFGKIPESQQPMVLQMIDVALKNLK